MANQATIEALLEEIATGRRFETLPEPLAAGGLETLRALVPPLRRELDFDAVERLEAVFKQVLLGLLAGGVSTAMACEIAALQRRLGFLIKKKPYAVKASSPLGYSVFLQEPGQGFSFQRHLEEKVEVFHILGVHPGGFVFICESDDWERLYDEAAFAAWLAGAEDPRYEPFRHRPEPGDVLVLDRLGIVHTVIGCQLEEFATVSLDLVERLHDQNDRSVIPTHLGRAFAEEGIRRLAAPAASRTVELPLASGRRAPIAPRRARWGTRTELLDGFVEAAVVRVEAGAVGAAAGGDDRATSLAVRQGSGAVHLEAGATAGVASPAVELGRGDLTLVPPGCSYRLAAGPRGLVAVEHRIGLDVAFARLQDPAAG